MNEAPRNKGLGANASTLEIRTYRVHLGHDQARAIERQFLERPHVELTSLALVRGKGADVRIANVTIARSSAAIDVLPHA